MIIVHQIVIHSLVLIEKNAAVAIAIVIKQQVMEIQVSARNLSALVHVLVTQALNVVVLVDPRQTEWVSMRL